MMRHPKISIDGQEDSFAAPEQKETLRELLELPVRQKKVEDVVSVIQNRVGLNVDENR